MIDLLKKKSTETYSEYKNSGDEWLGEIPKNWDVQRIGHLFEFRTLKVSDKDYEPLSVTYGGIKPRVDTAAVSQDGTKRKMVKKGDLAINGRSDRKGAAGIALQDGSVSLIYHVMKPIAEEVAPKFFHYLIRSQVFSEEFYRWGRGIVDDLWTTRSNEMKKISVVLPSFEEQQGIAEYLDEKTATIDAVIAKKKQLIKLLEEKRASIINEAVTKGLDPTAELVDSGVDWIGKIPKDWEETSLKWLSRRFSGGTPDRNNLEYWKEGTIPWLNSGSVNQRLITKPSSYITEKGLAGSSAKWIKKDSLAMALAGQGKTKGMVGIVKIETTCNQSMVVIEPSSKMQTNYLFWWLTSSYKRIRALAGDSDRDGLNLQLVGAIPCPIPDLQAQVKISDFLEKEYVKYEQIISMAKRSIKLLQEYRASLVSNVVTGKIKI